MKYTIKAEGYGGEFVMGKVSPEFVEEMQDYDVLPDEATENWYDKDDVEHITSCYEDTEFVVTDENDEIVYQGTLECSHTRDACALESGFEGYIPIMQCLSSEKGFFFTATFETDDFDANKLKTKYVETNLAFLVEQITYDGEELYLDFDDYDVRSKGFEAEVGWINPEWHEKEYVDHE